MKEPRVSTPIHLEERRQEGDKLWSPTAARNSGPIAKSVCARLKAGSSVLEIASGTGQQAAAICNQAGAITWQPSDPDSGSRKSMVCYQDETAGALLAPLNLDVTLPKWWELLEREFTHVFCANMIHIAPLEALHGLAKGAQSLLPAGGEMLLYGPFLDGANSAPSNLAFSERLKDQNPKWGVRELGFVKHIFATHALNFSSAVPMPANNQMLVFEKA